MGPDGPSILANGLPKGAIDRLRPPRINGPSRRLPAAPRRHLLPTARPPPGTSKRHARPGATEPAWSLALANSSTSLAGTRTTCIGLLRRPPSPRSPGSHSDASSEGSISVTAGRTNLALFGAGFSTDLALFGAGSSSDLGLFGRRIFRPIWVCSASDFRPIWPCSGVGAIRANCSDTTALNACRLPPPPPPHCTRRPSYAPAPGRHRPWRDPPLPPPPAAPR